MLFIYVKLQFNFRFTSIFISGKEKFIQRDIAGAVIEMYLGREPSGDCQEYVV